MAVNSAVQLNQTAQSRGKFLREPYALRDLRITVSEKSRKLNLSEIKAISAVYSFSTDERGESFTYSKFAKRHRISISTVGRAVRSAIAAKLIERGKGAHEYRLTKSTKELIDESAPKDENGERDPGRVPHLEVEDWIYDADFNGRYLTRMEIEVLFYLISLKKNPLYDNGVSRRFVTQRFGCSPTTVCKAVAALVEIGLITIEQDAVNKFQRMKYTVKDNLLRNKRRKVEKMLEEREGGSANGGERRQTPKSAADRAADARADRERFYSANQKRAQDRADNMLQRARSDEQFCAATKAISNLEMRLGQAEGQNLPNVEALRAQLLSARLVRKKRLALMNMTEEDLLPRYTCSKCSDTGNLPNGLPCDCYDVRRRRP